MTVAEMMRERTGVVLIAVDGHCYGFDCANRRLCDPWTHRSRTKTKVLCFLRLASSNAVMGVMHLHFSTNERKRGYI
jgi:hypothetical protein